MTRIPTVTRCDVAECGFNENLNCHAAAIQIGDQLGGAVTERMPVGLQDPKCDTFTRKPGARFGAGDLIAQVGACKADTCTYNEDLRCTAPGIQVGYHDSHADCKTYQPRMAQR